MATETETPNALAMSDEDFMQLNEPPASAGGEAVVTPEAHDAGDPPAEEEKPAEENNADLQDTSSKEDPDGGNGENKEDPVSDNKDPQAEATPKTAPVEDKPAEEKKPGEEAAASTPGSEAEPEVVAPDYEKSYKELMEPIKANGKTIEIRSTDELRQLAQMGANYTRKMQDIAPHRKTLLMLQDNGLLDPAKLSFLIDIEKKNPEAIKKLIKDSGIDPMDLDLSVEPAYTAGAHTVTDAEANFREALESAGSSADGKVALQVIDTTWDQTSKEMLLTSPEVIDIVRIQKGNGIYDRIQTEIEREVALGKIPSKTPFLQAYTEVGKRMTEAGAFDDLLGITKPATKEPVVVAVREAKPKEAVANGDAAAAAAPGRTSPKAAAVLINPLAMSDEDFLKLPQNV